MKKDGYSASTYSRTSINKACRALYYTHPIVNSIINSHSEIPLNYLRVDLPDNKSAAVFYKNLFEEIQFRNIIHEIIKEYWIVGEVFIYAELNEAKGSWNRLFLQDPDYIIVKRSAIEKDCSYFLRPDENLRRIVLSEKEEDKASLKYLNEKIISNIKNGENITLDNFYISHIARKNSPYEVRGTGLLNPILKLANKESEINSKTIRECLTDPFSITSNIQLETLKFKYNTLFNAIEEWLDKKIFLPLAKINSFYKLTDGVKYPILPSLKFDRDGLIKALSE